MNVAQLRMSVILIPKRNWSSSKTSFFKPTKSRSQLVSQSVQSFCRVHGHVQQTHKNTKKLFHHDTKYPWVRGHFPPWKCPQDEAFCQNLFTTCGPTPKLFKTGEKPPPKKIKITKYFSRPDALPVAQTTESKDEYQPSKLIHRISSYLGPLLDCWRKGCHTAVTSANSHVMLTITT